MKKILALVIATAMCVTFGTAAFAEETPVSVWADTIETVDAEADEAAEAEETVSQYDAFTAAEVDEEVTVQVYVMDHQSWWDGTVSVYACDEDGGYFIYNMTCAEEDAELLTPGTMIEVTGYKSEWSGEVEIVDAAFTFVEDAEPYIPQIIDVTEYMGTDDIINYMNQAVQFTDCKIVASADADGNEAAFLYNWDGSGEEGNDLYFNVEIGGETYQFTVESYLYGPETEIYQAVKELKIGDTVTLQGFLYWYNGPNPHIGNIVK